MPDVGVVWTGSYGDWGVSNGGLAVDSGLESAVLLSLFTDRLATPDFVPPDGSKDRRGHWSDTYESSPLGSNLWQLERAVKSNATAVLAQARTYCLEALQWLIDDQVVASIAVMTAWVSATTLGIAIVITAPNGSTQTFDYAWAWNTTPPPAPPFGGGQFINGVPVATESGFALVTEGGVVILADDGGASLAAQGIITAEDGDPVQTEAGDDLTAD